MGLTLDPYYDDGAGNDLLFATPEDDVIDVLEGNDNVVSALDGNDTVFGGLGDENIFGAAGDDELNGGEGTDYIRGGIGNDLIDGGEGEDTLDGVTTFFSPQPGLGEIDELTGDEGSDLFKLGQISPTRTPTVFYDDGDTATAGKNDYALISDFDLKEEDKIQLVREISDYSLAASPQGFPNGTAIYLNDGESPELIAIVKDVEPSTLDLHNPNQFQGNVPITEVSVFAEPDTPITEAEENPGSFKFQLSEPAPEDGLTIYFRAGDDDPFLQSRDVSFNPEANTNIDDISVVPLSDRTSFITISEGVTEASFVVTPLLIILSNPMKLFPSI